MKGTGGGQGGGGRAGTCTFCLCCWRIIKGSSSVQCNPLRTVQYSGVLWSCQARCTEHSKQSTNWAAHNRPVHLQLRPCSVTVPLHSRISPLLEVPPQPVPALQGRHHLRGVPGHTLEACTVVVGVSDETGDIYRRAWVPILPPDLVDPPLHRAVFSRFG
jgi:hypothetical protein